MRTSRSLGTHRSPRISALPDATRMTVEGTPSSEKEPQRIDPYWNHRGAFFDDDDSFGIALNSHRLNAFKTEGGVICPCCVGHASWAF